MNDELFRQMTTEIYFEREEDSNKSDFGRCLLIGSSKAYPLAILIAESAATKVGNGYLALAVPEEVFPIAASRCSLTTVFEHFDSENGSFLPDQKDFETRINRYDSILFGNGVEVTEANHAFLAKLIQCYHHTLVLDASAISLLSVYGRGILYDKSKDETIVLTPHLGEADRLFDTDHHHSRNPKDYLEDAFAFNVEYRTSLLLKSYYTYYVDEKDAILSVTPSTVCLAKAGSGDGLAGYLAGILAYPLTQRFSEKVLYADKMIHTAAAMTQQGNTEAANILDAIDFIRAAAVTYRDEEFEY